MGECDDSPAVDTNHDHLRNDSTSDTGRAGVVRARTSTGRPSVPSDRSDDDITFQPLGSEAVRFTTDETRHEIECADIAIEPPPDVRAGVYGQS